MATSTVAPPTPTATGTAEPDLTICSPLEFETIASLFEIVSNPFDQPPPGKDDHHHGVDLAYYRRGDRLSIAGVTIQSILPGTVSASIIDRLPYGNMVIIETPRDRVPKKVVDSLGVQEGESLYALYAHMEEPPMVSLADQVTCGQPLGYVGTTGYDIVEPHLHLEIRLGPAGARFANMAFYDTNAIPDEMNNYLRWRTSGEFKPKDPMQVFSIYLSP